MGGVMEGGDARDVDRRLLSALRRVERRTRLHAEWTRRGVAYRFFDYVPKAERPRMTGCPPQLATRAIPKTSPLPVLTRPDPR